MPTDGDTGEPGPVMPERWDRAARESAAAVVGAIAGGLVRGPEGAVAAALVAPHVHAAIDTFTAGWTVRRREGAGRVVLVAADELGTTPEGLLATATADPARELLTGQALNAGALTVHAGKIRALGRVVARVLDGEPDEAVLDESGLLIAALADLEAPHIRLLTTLATHPHGGLLAPDDSWGPQVTQATLAHEHPSLAGALDNLLGTLERHGLLTATQGFNEAVRQQQAMAAYSGRQPDLGDLRVPVKYTITRFGIRMVHLVSDDSASDAT